MTEPIAEHDACGVGFVAHRLPSHAVLAAALSAVSRMSHRGAVSADGKSGDGAGVLTQLPYNLLRRDLPLGDVPDQDLALAMVFLPPAAADDAAEVLDQAVRAEGLRVLGWRPVPVDPDALGAFARVTQPVIRQLAVGRRPGDDDAAFTRSLYLARRTAERRLRERGLGAYIASFSHRTVVYKGLFVSPQLGRFYRDLTDPAYTTRLAVFHQRYSTNTSPSWWLAQPFRYLAHNGEINTLQGNLLWTRAREAMLRRSVWADRWEDLVPLLQEGGSDSAHLDSVLELLVASGRSLLHALLMLVPQAWEEIPDLPDAVRAFYEYHACLTEPWDGPAALACSDGRIVAAALDRNGLRPARYAVTAEGLVVLASEAGVLPLPAEQVVRRGRLGPGQVLAVDTATGQVLADAEIKAQLAAARPYAEWTRRTIRVPDGNREAIPPGAAEGPREVEDGGAGPAAGGGTPAADLPRRQQLFGYTAEEVAYLLLPMATEGKEVVFSMGDDTPPAALARRPRLLYDYFRQRFAQVTNPPIDPLRERLVMSLAARVGPRRNWLEDGPEHAALLVFPSPVLTPDQLGWARARAPWPAVALDATWRADRESLETALGRLAGEAEAAVARGAGLIILSDRAADAARIPVPMLLATGAVHHHLIREGLRTSVGLLVESGEARTVHQLACLLGYGAEAVCPYLALETAAALPSANGRQPSARRYRSALEQGLLKVASKMGISTLAGYQGGQVFEVVGLDRRVVERYFPGTPAHLGGVSLDDLAAQAAARHARAFAGDGELADPGLVRFRRDGEYHAFNPYVVKRLHQAAQSGGGPAYAAFSDLVASRPPTALRDLLAFVPRPPVPLEEVEPAEAIVRRFVLSAMSHGALSREAHEALAIAANRLGARSNSGEGGEDPARYLPRPDGTSANSRIKQVASARFGVTAAYLVSADELEIKMAQGSKPGEGGQLPGHKVSAEIAAIRRAQPGITLISPPPHHDIYSIEDLAQLIYDLKRVHPLARVAVKLVAEAGVGTVAAGVAKAFADTIQISGHDGGTGASPLESIKHVGLPWELGLAEAQQALVASGLRGRVRLRVDGGLKTGRDVVVAALLGADEFGFGTAALVALGCVMARACHLNTCPTGIATQREDLRRRFSGRPDRVEAYLLGVAEEVRRHLAALGARTLEEVIGRSELLYPVDESVLGRRIGLSALLTGGAGAPEAARRCVQPRNKRPEGPTLDDRIWQDAWPSVERGVPVHLTYPITNMDRTVGGRLAGAIARRYGEGGLAEGRVVLRFTGSAGQSFGAFCVPGMVLELEGEVNDYAGKGMSGGTIAIRPPRGFAGASHENVIAGNTLLYGATGGRLFAAGRAGERFAVRNSGAVAVVEGVGDHGCEYMTGGVVVVLGRAGYNFGAGMTGGRAYVLDEDGGFAARCNLETVAVAPVEAEDLEGLRDLIAEHLAHTGSRRAAGLLQTWPAAAARFVKIIPHGPAGQEAGRARHLPGQEAGRASGMEASFEAAGSPNSELSGFRA